MDVESAFLNGYIKEEVYVSQPPRFIDCDFPSHVYCSRVNINFMHVKPTLPFRDNIDSGATILR